MRRSRLVQPDSALVARWGASSLIKSIQRGTIAITGATSNTATVTAVDTANARLKYVGATYNNVAGTVDKAAVKIVLTNSTTITANVITSPGADTCTVSYELIEYWPGVIKSVQRGTMNGATTATITEVNTAKSEVDWLGSTDTTGGITATFITRLTLTNGTTVTSNIGVVTAAVTSYQVVEWF